MRIVPNNDVYVNIRDNEIINTVQKVWKVGGSDVIIYYKAREQIKRLSRK